MKNCMEKIKTSLTSAYIACATGLSDEEKQVLGLLHYWIFQFLY